MRSGAGGAGGARAVCILGVDPGIRATGWGVLRGTEGRWEIGLGAIRPLARASTGDRLRALLEGLLRVIDEQRPSAVAVERPFMQQHARAALTLAQAQAAALLAAALRDLPTFEYAPREVKQAVTGDGGAEKGAVARALQLRLALPAPPRPIDAADALAVAYCHHVLGGHGKGGLRA